MLQTGDVFAGYVIQRVLGRGGMGTVYSARHPRLPRLTALKLLKRELYADADIRRRFEREADLVSRLDHPNIVTVFDRGAEDQQLWISMQYVPGADASCADVDVLAPGRAVQIVADTAAALDFAHANQVLHRDVKPANILLAKAPIGQPERVLLTDFGIAGVRGADTTIGSSGSITATLAFGAPEQLIGQPLDDRADQYSLACTLFWMLTGAPPYPGANPAAVVNSHLYAPIPVLSRVRPGLPPALDPVLARAMAKRPADRFASCAEFAAAARYALAGQRIAPHTAAPQLGIHADGNAPTQHTAPAAPQQPTPPTQHTAPAPPRPSTPQEPPRQPAPPRRSFPPPRRPVHPGMIELPNLPIRPGSAVRPHQQPPDPRPPPTRPSRRSPACRHARRAIGGHATTAMVSMFSVVRPISDRAF
ncbi:serine/threonine protein kinase [Nocardia sp. NBC_00508]|uniref:serine/threonine-protein kinase n=1 Tax=Nocardia sp. NBC_00508 TaxID=2975992 RepID=UPI002E7FF465|nr:serine/threonine-protein kinase [Nocardia sp. NBC_00508]WUD64366.1 serine/threonine protein kinase [Nocardia sp. NBC_00508]